MDDNLLAFLLALLGFFGSLVTTIISYLKWRAERTSRSRQP